MEDTLTLVTLMVCVCLIHGATPLPQLHGSSELSLELKEPGSGTSVHHAIISGQALMEKIRARENINIYNAGVAC